MKRIIIRQATRYPINVYEVPNVLCLFHNAVLTGVGKADGA